MIFGKSKRNDSHAMCRKVSVIVEGYLNLESQEGGYAEPAWRLDGASLADIVVSHFEIKRVTWDKWTYEANLPYVPGDLPVGRVRITIEQLKGE